jgi:hypothetical protein
MRFRFEPCLFSTVIYQHHHTALMMAIFQGRADCVDHLLSNGFPIDVNAQSSVRAHANHPRSKQSGSMSNAMDYFGIVFTSLSRTVRPHCGMPCRLVTCKSWTLCCEPVQTLSALIRYAPAHCKNTFKRVEFFACTSRIRLNKDTFRYCFTCCTRTHSFNTFALSISLTPSSWPETYRQISTACNQYSEIRFDSADGCSRVWAC